MKKIIISAICFLVLAAAAFAEDTIAQITKDKVGQTVKLSGSVESFAASKSEKAPASIKLKDSAGGSIRVAIWPDVFAQIAGKDSIQPGAKIEVSAKVAEFRGSIELHVDAASDVKVEGATAAPGASAAPAAKTAPAAPAAAVKPAETTAAPAAAAASSGSVISSITKDKVKQTVSISGTVASFSPSKSETAPASINVKDDSGSIRVAIWPDVFAQISGKDDLKPGTKVSVKAKVAEFRGNVELHVDSASDVQVNGAAVKPADASAAAPAAPATTAEPAKAAVSAAPGGKVGIASLKEKMNQNVTITGKVAKARKPSSDTAPYIINIQGDDGSVDVVFWQTLADQLGADQKPNIGDSVEISGVVAEYRGNVQVKPDKPSDIKIMKGSAAGSEGSTTASQAALTEMPLSQISTAKAHQRVKVSGTIESVEPVHAGKKMTLKDPSGSATLLVWDTAEGGSAGAHSIKANAKVTVAATVEQDEGKPVLTVSKPEDSISVGDSK